jgi:hypothetical protein
LILRHCYKDHVYSCQLGTICPIMHAKQDQVYPIGFSYASPSTPNVLSCMQNRTECVLSISVMCPKGQTHGIQPSYMSYTACKIGLSVSYWHPRQTHGIQPSYMRQRLSRLVASLSSASTCSGTLTIDGQTWPRKHGTTSKAGFSVQGYCS